MFKKVLVANRGEIAVRIIRACRELGMETVAVFSEADRHALHVRYADEAYLLGPAPSRESYLRADKILDIAKQSGADAIHPGYGFLAEREDFATTCEDKNITFIGPKPSSIAAMGDKAKARATVIKAGVPVVPGTEDVGNMTDDDLLGIAPRIGFPLLDQSHCRRRRKRHAGGEKPGGNADPACTPPDAKPNPLSAMGMFILKS